MEKPTHPDEYLARLEPERRARLETIRAVVQSTCPEATEDVLYGMPGFRLGKHHLAAYAAAKRHDGFYPCSGQVISQHPEIGVRFKTSSGAVQFPLDAPVPEDVVVQLVRTRIAEIEAGGR
jgi:uncharacterized protein YdhG (YjbR/CyaY superfamily)